MVKGFTGLKVMEIVKGKLRMGLSSATGFYF